MRILQCCEFYNPIVGGVQVVMQQLAERFVARGHQVTVATTHLHDRAFSELNGVHLKQFKVYGNFVSGLSGEVKAYQQFVISGGFDVVMIKAAQQWTFDALWPVLDFLPAVKVFIPCGFSRFFEPSYTDYFKRLPEILQKFDQLIFYATDYRDINFAKEHGIKQISIIPNGACEVEFSFRPDPVFRASLGIAADDFLFLTVGSFTGLKGHLEVAKAFAAANLHGRPATLVLNGNRCVNHDRSMIGRMKKVCGLVKTCGIKYVTKHIIKTTLRSLGLRVGKEEELHLVLETIKKQPGKTVLVTDLPRKSLIQAFMSADLFVFASNIEYSPLVLYEAAAAGTPFLTVPVGNAAEIAVWTGAGVVCPALQDDRGYTRVDPLQLALHMEKLADDPQQLQILGDAGRKNWQENFNWGKISTLYETIFENHLSKKAAL